MQHIGFATEPSMKRLFKPRSFEQVVSTIAISGLHTCKLHDLFDSLKSPIRTSKRQVYIAFTIDNHI